MGYKIVITQSVWRPAIYLFVATGEKYLFFAIITPTGRGKKDNYEERQLAHAMLDQPRRPVDLDLFSQSIRIQSSQAEKIMAGLRDRLIRDLAKGKGNVIAGGEGSPLPWWLVR